MTRKINLEHGPGLVDIRPLEWDPLEAEQLSPRDVLINFLELDGMDNISPEDLSRIEAVLESVTDIAHVGVMVRNIDQAVYDMQLKYPERDYTLVKKFPSVGIPKIYDGSTATIGQVVSNSDQKHLGLELFEVNWQGDWSQLSVVAQEKLIEHIALHVRNSDDVEKATDVLIHDNSRLASVVPININPVSREKFGYLINTKGAKVEIMHCLPTEEIT